MPFRLDLVHVELTYLTARGRGQVVDSMIWSYINSLHLRLALSLALGRLIGLFDGGIYLTRS